MTPTSVSLLDRLKLARPDATDWARLKELYFPLIQRRLKQVPGIGEEVDDLAQDILLNVNSVLLAKSRVLKRLREEAGEFLG